jgi:hypothetical protein
LLVGSADTVISSGIIGKVSVLPSMDENSTEIQPKFPFASIQTQLRSSLNPYTLKQEPEVNPLITSNCVLGPLRILNVIPSLTQPIRDGIEVAVKVAEGNGEGDEDGRILVGVDVCVAVSHDVNKTTQINNI